MTLLSPVKIREELQKLPGWEFVDGKLYQEYKFSNFPTAVLFVNKLVDPAEELDHHPHIIIKYDRVQVFLFTHQLGGITEKDILLAQRIEELSQ